MSQKLASAVFRFCPVKAPDGHPKISSMGGKEGLQRFSV